MGSLARHCPSPVRSLQRFHGPGGAARRPSGSSSLVSLARSRGPRGVVGRLHVARASASQQPPQQRSTTRQSRPAAAAAAPGTAAAAAVAADAAATVSSDAATSATATSAPSTLATPVVMTDNTVPEGHQGLHGFLYGDSGADVHDAEEDDYQVRRGEDDGSALLTLEEFELSRRGHKLAGVYALYDSQQGLQYVGYSRNILLSLKGHTSSAATGALCSWVRVRVFRDPAMLTRARLDQERQQWMRELCQAGGMVGTVLAPGNQESARHLWESNSGPAARSAALAMSEEERAEYEEKKLKMRKAMGENVHDDVEGETLDSRQRRLALLQAVEGDDWSAVIHQQTQQTVEVAAAAATATAAPAPSVQEEHKVSPFASGQDSGGERGQSKQVVAEEEAEAVLEMTKENVDVVLNAVRPYLIADGGNVEVVAVDPRTGTVDLQLQGACGTCPSSTVTMKMGIERHLREKFGSRLGEVRQVGNGTGQPAAPSIELVDAHLEMLRPAIRNFNGSVEVLSVDNLAGVCQVRYSGPAPVGMGVQAAIKDKFPSLHTVTLVNP